MIHRRGGQSVPGHVCLVQSVVLSRCRHSRYGGCLVARHVTSIFLHPFAPPALPGFLATMGALTPGRAALRILIRDNELRPAIRSGLFASCIESSRRSVSNHLLSPPEFSLVLFRKLTARSADRIPCSGPGRHLGFAFRLQARHDNRPNRVRHPTDRRFTSSCSPPPLARTQLLSVTEFRPNPDKDLHLADSIHSQTHAHRGREGRLGSRPPLPPNRTGGFPASGSPVSGFTSKRIDEPRPRRDKVPSRPQQGYGP